MITDTLLCKLTTLRWDVNVNSCCYGCVPIILVQKYEHYQSDTVACVLCIRVRSRNCGCLVTWFCYQLIAKPGNKTAAVSWPDPYDDCRLNINPECVTKDASVGHDRCLRVWKMASRDLRPSPYNMPFGTFLAEVPWDNRAVTNNDLLHASQFDYNYCLPRNQQIWLPQFDL